MDEKSLAQLWNKLFFFITCPLLLLSALWCWQTEIQSDHWLLIRLLGLLLLLFAVLICVLSSRSRRKRLIVALWIGFLLTRMSPIEITAENYPGPPHFVPLVMGTLASPIEERASESDRQYMWGGCVVSGFEPKKVWVW